MRKNKKKGEKSLSEVNRILNFLMHLQLFAILFEESADKHDTIFDVERVLS